MTGRKVTLRTMMNASQLRDNGGSHFDNNVILVGGFPASKDEARKKLRFIFFRGREPSYEGMGEIWGESQYHSASNSTGGDFLYENKTKRQNSVECARITAAVGGNCMDKWHRVLQLLTAFPEVARESFLDVDLEATSSLCILIKRRACVDIISAVNDLVPEIIGQERDRQSRPAALHFACNPTYGPVLQEIVSYVVRMQPDHTRIADQYGNLPIHYSLGVTNARITCLASLGTLKALLDIHPGSAMSKNKDGRTPLHLALEWGLTEDIFSCILGKWPEQVGSFQIECGNNEIRQQSTYPDLHSVRLLSKLFSRLKSLHCDLEWRDSDSFSAFLRCLQDSESLSEIIFLNVPSMTLVERYHPLYDPLMRLFRKGISFDTIRLNIPSGKDSTAVREIIEDIFKANNHIRAVHLHLEGAIGNSQAFFDLLGNKCMPKIVKFESVAPINWRHTGPIPRNLDVVNRTCRIEKLFLNFSQMDIGWQRGDRFDNFDHMQKLVALLPRIRTLKSLQLKLPYIASPKQTFTHPLHSILTQGGLEDVTISDAFCTINVYLICQALRSNATLKRFVFKYFASTPFDNDVDQYRQWRRSLVDVLERFNVTLEHVDIVPQDMALSPEDELIEKRINYYTNMNVLGKQICGSPTASIVDFVDYLCRLSLVEPNVQYGALRATPSLWCDYMLQFCSGAKRKRGAMS